MRKIVIGGIEYPVHASMNIRCAFDKKMNAFMDSAQDKDAALKAFMADISVNLWLVAMLINEAVDYESVMNGRDIRADVPHYPLDERKIGMIASATDLNSDATVQAIADEFADCMGTEKNFTAAQLKQMATRYLTTDQ